MNESQIQNISETPAPVVPETPVPTNKKERRAARKAVALQKFLEEIEPVRRQARLSAFQGGKLTPFVRQFLSKEELELVLEARREARSRPTVRKLRKFLGIDSGRQWRKFRKAQQRIGLPVEAYVGQAIVNQARAREAQRQQASDVAATIIGPDLTNGDIIAKAAEIAAKPPETKE
jgi:hypothetical protein